MTAKEANRRSRQGQAAAIKHEPALKAKYEAVLRANAKRVARAYKSTGITAAGKVPTLDEVLAEAALASSATARTKVERQRIAEESAAPLITDAGKRELRKLVEPIVARQAGAQAERIVAGVKDRVAAIMMESLIEGYSVPDTASLLQANLELDAIWQAEMLARTDLISLSNAASHEAAASLENGPKFKTWLSASDARVRPEHQLANGQTVPIDKPYLVGDDLLDYPGDPKAPDDATINCRCVSVFTDSSSPGLAHSEEGGIHDQPVTEFDATTAPEEEAQIPEASGDVTNVESMVDGSTNPVYKAELDGNPVVIKPENQLSATQLRTHVEPGFDLDREQAAQHVATLLAADSPELAVPVPAYRIKDVQGYGRSGVADFVEGQTVANAYRVGDREALTQMAQGKQIDNVRLYDGIIGNTDRHEGNLMIDPAGKVHAIDHGLAFPSVNQEAWPSVQGGASVVPLEAVQRVALEQLRPRLVGDTVLPELLTDAQRQGMQQRIDFMLRNNRLPTSDDWQNGWVDDAN